jgi:hypothetical protein
MTRRTDRRRQADLLGRPPSGVQDLDDRWAALLIDTSAQIDALADLVRRGLLTPAEFDQHKAKVLDAVSGLVAPAAARSAATRPGSATDALP